MKAVLCREFGDPHLLVVEDIDDPIPGPGEVLIEVAAAGVNYPDTLTIRDMYQLKPRRPFSPGSELAGVVTALGEGVDRVAVGDRVIGLTGAAGAFAEKAVVDVKRIVSVPARMSLDLAAAFLFTYGTSHHALVDRADPKPGENLVVLGAAGGVGLVAVEIGSVLGLNVIAAASTDEKLAVCRDHGASETINYTTEDLKQRVKDLGGADIVYDPVGGQYAEPVLRAMNWLGRYLVIGFPAGIPSFPLNLVLLKGCDVRGVFWGSALAHQPEVLATGLGELTGWFTQGRLSPHVSGRYPLERASQAIQDMMDRKAVGKLVIEVNPALY